MKSWKMKCPYCLLKRAKTRIVELSNGGYFVSNSCNDCQRKVDKAIKNTKLVQRGLLKKYRTVEGL